MLLLLLPYYYYYFLLTTATTTSSWLLLVLLLLLLLLLLLILPLLRKSFQLSIYTKYADNTTEIKIRLQGHYQQQSSWTEIVPWQKTSVSLYIFTNHVYIPFITVKLTKSEYCKWFHTLQRCSDVKGMKLISWTTHPWST